MSFWQTLAAFMVGGAVTFLTQLILEARREKKARERAEAAEETEIRMAARLVLLDLISVLSLLKAARQTGRWWTAQKLPIGAWETHSPVLSRGLPDQTWRTVGSTFAGAAGWNQLAGGARRYYYWVMPHLNLQRLGGADMLDAMRVGAAEGIGELLAIAVPSVQEDDPLHGLATDALREDGGR